MFIYIQKKPHRFSGPLLRARLVTPEKFTAELVRLGGLYFVRDEEADCIKIGHSHAPYSRLSTLQVGSARGLRMVGLIAAPPRAESILHSMHGDDRERGEWFRDRGVLTQWLMDVTHGEPIGRNVWTEIDGTDISFRWHAETQDTIQHIWDPEAGIWEPVIR